MEQRSAFRSEASDSGGAATHRPRGAEPPPGDRAGGDKPASVVLPALSDRERDRLRLLARRYPIRRDVMLRPRADVLSELRLPRGNSAQHGKVLELLRGKAGQ